MALCITYDCFLLLFCLIDLLRLVANMLHTYIHQVCLILEDKPEEPFSHSLSTEACLSVRFLSQDNWMTKYSSDLLSFFFFFITLRLDVKEKPVLVSVSLLSSALVPAVQYQSGLYGENNNSSSPVSSRGNSPIACERCGEVCRGEVVRVKNTHFHIHCFTCQGKKTHFYMFPHIRCTLIPNSFLFCLVTDARVSMRGCHPHQFA